MRILAVVPSLFDTSPGQRFRMEQWAPLLAPHGVSLDFAAFESRELHEVLYRPGHMGRKVVQIARAFARRAAVVRSVRGFDAIYVFREAALLGPALFERLIGRSGVPLVFDFDDAIFESYISPSNGYLSLLKCPGKTAAICRVASHVMAGNPYLASYARRFNDRVTVVPTTIDTAKYRPVSRPANATPVIGWSGSYSTVQHLRSIDGALRRLAVTHPFRLRVIGTPTYALDGVAVDAMSWQAAREVEDLQPIDIGVMPLPNDRWSRGKCALKALQYMALGIPTVCSPVGVNADVIQHGENGLLAATEDEWVAALSRLIDRAELRRSIGTAGRATVESRYSAVVQAPIVRALFEQVARRA